MKKYILLKLLFMLMLVTGGVAAKPINESPQISSVRGMIKAVNERSSADYVKPFADNVEIFVGSELKVSGKEKLQLNRKSHFEGHPEVRSEIQHLIEIDNKVIMHDKVWLTKADQEGRDIVEIFTFINGEISRVDVIQTNDLFDRRLD